MLKIEIQKRNGVCTIMLNRDGNPEGAWLVDNPLDLIEIFIDIVRTIW